MINLLAIETSSEACSVALSVGGEARELHRHAPMQHAELLLPDISRLLAEAGLATAALDVIAFGRGPGSFTSLRIGIGVVQGLAWAAQLPVVPCSSLAAVAQDALDRDDGAAARVRVAVDARMQEVFTADFRRSSNGLVIADGPESVCPPAQVAESAPEPFAAAGNAFERFVELKRVRDAAIACYADAWPRASVIARLALAWLEHHEPLPADRAQPVYVRNNVAEKPQS
jgi:tRNA threonylcarbamoyladenosine biosynthesis protein TsaB